ncbi:MAG: hypothetical protein LBD78_00840 [Spirochaetaceae bacterium]|jgi:hypothetical protein|nr:hypothetical protein [Spirochaetaceae bacterium]
MNTGIRRFRLEGKTVLGFDTGLNSQAFAQAKMAQFINQPGYIVFPPRAGETRNGAGDIVETWKPLGVMERSGTMVVWGSDFPGKALDLIIADSGDDVSKDTALEALRCWIRARRILEGKGAGLSRNTNASANPAPEFPVPWPAGALVVVPEAGATPEPGVFPGGTILFPPERLLRRTVEAPGPETWLSRAERWVHPDLSGGESSAFTAAALAYRLFCGTPPFEARDAETIHQDMREGNYMPPRFRAPGLRDDIAAFISEGLSFTVNRKRERIPQGGNAAALKDPEQILGPPGSAGFSACIRTPDAETLKKITAEREQYRKKNDLSVKSRRFVRRNVTILAVGFAVLAISALSARSIIRSRAELPNTRGMSPAEVIEAYYGAFGTLDHTLMEACVINKAGKNDISMITNIFVISKVRQAYEMNTMTIDVREWQAAGSPPTEATVVGVTDLQLLALDTDGSDGELSYRVSGLLWVPPEGDEPLPDESPERPPVPAVTPVAYPFADELRLSWHKDSWRISGLERAITGLE